MSTSSRILEELLAGTPVKDDGFDQYRKTLGADKVDAFLEKLGLGPRYKPTKPTVHLCPQCRKLGAIYKEVHPDTDMNTMILTCPACGYEAE